MTIEEYNRLPVPERMKLEFAPMLKELGKTAEAEIAAG